MNFRKVGEDKYYLNYKNDISINLTYGKAQFYMHEIFMKVKFKGYL